MLSRMLTFVILAARPASCWQGAYKFINGEYLMPCTSQLPPLTFTIGGKVRNVMNIVTFCFTRTARGYDWTVIFSDHGVAIVEISVFWFCLI